MKKIILGTDWGSDVDDVVALRILAKAHKQGEISIEGIAVNHFMENSVKSLEGFLNTEGLHNIPLGIDKNAHFGKTPTYQNILCDYAQRYHSNGDVMDAVRLYRTILANAKEKVEIAEIGFLQVVADLLKSGNDDISDKTGIELVRQKVKKFWIMAGKWDEQGGKEFNFSCNEITSAAAADFCELCPVPVTFLGFETGKDVITGTKLDKDDILYKAMCAYGSANGRFSWDPMLVALSLTGDEVKAGYDVVCGKASVDRQSGRNYFEKNENGAHRYVVRKYNAEYYRDVIDGLIE